MNLYHKLNVATVATVIEENNIEILSDFSNFACVDSYCNKVESLPNIPTIEELRTNIQSSISSTNSGIKLSGGYPDKDVRNVIYLYLLSSLDNQTSEKSSPNP
jgi:hypothetical protein